MSSLLRNSTLETVLHPFPRFLWGRFSLCFTIVEARSAVPVSVPEKRFRRFRFQVQFLAKRFRRFRLPVPVGFLGHLHYLFYSQPKINSGPTSSCQKKANLHVAGEPVYRPHVHNVKGRAPLSSSSSFSCQLPLGLARPLLSSQLSMCDPRGEASVVVVESHLIPHVCVCSMCLRGSMGDQMMRQSAFI